MIRGKFQWRWLCLGCVALLGVGVAAGLAAASGRFSSPPPPAVDVVPTGSAPADRPLPPAGLPVEFFLEDVSAPGVLNLLTNDASNQEGELVQLPQPPTVADAPKRLAIERSASKLVADLSARVPARAAPANPKVEPGKVKWHADFAAARAASAKSGKPVLLFQMLGKLDEQFC